MMPAGTRVLRRERRRAWRGTPTGRRATHAVQTTYGRHQKDAEHRAQWAAFHATVKAMTEATPDLPETVRSTA